MAFPCRGCLFNLIEQRCTSTVFLPEQSSSNGQHPCVTHLYRIPMGIFNCVINYGWGLKDKAPAKFKNAFR